MGLDLSLLPFFSGSANFSMDVLRMPPNYEIFDKIGTLPSMEVDDGFNSYLSRDKTCKESHFGVTTENPYGDRVVFVLAKDLKTVGIPGPVGAYIQAMEDRHKIALYWR